MARSGQMVSRFLMKSKRKNNLCMQFASKQGRIPALINDTAACAAGTGVLSAP